jgi:DNA-binding LacI/PurR family transcriptional regulator
MDAAKACDVNVISFMAHKLDCPLGFEAQANVLYDLVSPDRLDGVLIFTAPLINTAGPAGIERGLEQYRPLPMVAIEEGAPDDIPRLVIDYYRPVHDLVAHLIEIHGRRRIAFVRGPEETYIGARQRYQGYRDALASTTCRLTPAWSLRPPNGHGTRK